MAAENRERPMFSVITVCRNAAEVLRGTMESVFSQTCNDVEYIVIDGASTDGTVELLKEYEKKAAVPTDDRCGTFRFRWISEPDSGIYQAMNKGIALASGDWVHFLHAGDRYAHKDALENISRLDLEEKDVLASPIKIVTGPDSLRIWRPEYLPRERHYRFPHTGIFILNSFYRATGGYRDDFKIISDGLFYSDHFPNARISIEADLEPTVIMHIGLSGKLSCRYLYENLFNMLYFHDFPIKYRWSLLRSFISSLVGRLHRTENGVYRGQYHQDRFIDRNIFSGKRKGVFMDIGANDGITYSNTYFFEKEREWIGFCVEPSPATFAVLQKNRKCHLFNLAIASTSGSAVFHVAEGESNMLSVLKTYCSSDHRARMERETAEKGGTIAEVTVECMAIGEFLERNGIREVDYLSLDIEGGEYDVLQAIDFDRFSAKVISVELNQLAGETERLLLKNRYFLCAIRGCDAIYFRSSLCYPARKLLSALARRGGLGGRLAHMMARCEYALFI